MGVTSGSSTPSSGPAGRAWRVAAGAGVDVGLDAMASPRTAPRRSLPRLRAHHRHVARLVVDAILLLEAGVVLLVDHDQAEIGVGQEQRRAGADHHARLAAWRPRARPARARRRRAPNATRPGGQPKRRLKRSMNWLVSAISGSMISACTTLLQGARHGLEVDLGLAGAGDAVDAASPRSRASAAARRVWAAAAWASVSSTLAMGRVGRGEALLGDRHLDQHAGCDQTVDQRRWSIWPRRRA